MISLLITLFATQTRAQPRPVVVLPSADGKTVSRLGEDEAVRTWDAVTGKLLYVSDAWVIQTPKSRMTVNVQTKYNSARKLYTLITLSNAETGKVVRSLKVDDDGPSAISFSPDQRQLIFAGSNFRARFWNMDTGHLLQFPIENASIYCAVLSKDKRTVLMRTFDGIHDSLVWRSYPSGKLLRKIKIEAGGYSPTVITPDLKWLFRDHGDKLCQVSTSTGKVVRRVKVAGDRPYDLWLSANAEFVITASSSHRNDRSWMELWSIAPNATTPVAKVLSAARVNRFAQHELPLSHESRSETGFWKQAGYQPKILPETVAVVKGADQLSSPIDKCRLILSLDRGHDVELNTAAWDLPRSLRFVLKDGSTPEGFRCKTISPNGEYFVDNGSETESARAWEASTGKLRWALKREFRWNSSISISPDNSLVTVAYRPPMGNGGPFRFDTPLQVLDAQSGRVVWQLPVDNENRGTNCNFTPDGERIVTWGTVQDIVVWNAHTGEKLVNVDPKTQRVEAVAVDNDTIIGIVNNGESMTAWDSSTGRQKWTRKLPYDRKWDPTITKDHHRVVMRDQDSLIGYSIASGQPIHPNWIDDYRGIGTPTNFEGRKCIALLDQQVLRWDQYAEFKAPELERQTGRVRPTLTLIDEDSGKVVAQAYVIQADRNKTEFDWLVLRSDGRFSGSTGVERYLRTPVGNRMLPDKPLHDKRMETSQ